ncbi:hypothetical protein L218DRAFT_1003134 [Marasmius fiardii PR-910]|nr:hypothetical protein L218DRAFT_1003134 [Marasmius fiardii PR-910]
MPPFLSRNAMCRLSTPSGTTPSRPSTDCRPDHDDIQEILSEFYMDNESESSDSVESEGGEKCGCLDSSDNECSHIHYGKGEQEAGELYDLYGDDVEENEEDARSSTEDSDDYPSEYSPTDSLPPKTPTNSQRWLYYVDERLDDPCGATCSKPKPNINIDAAVAVAMENPLSCYAGRPESGEIECGVDDNPR